MDGRHPSIARILSFAHLAVMPSSRNGLPRPRLIQSQQICQHRLVDFGDAQSDADRAGGRS